jgi:hypothetical protein
MMSKKASWIYVFRCGESGLYALTADPTGEILPSQIYPQVSWHLERRVTLERDKSSAKQELINATLDAINKRGFLPVCVRLRTNLRRSRS